MEFDLSGHRALVTGSSRGIGSAVALELASHGADVYVHCTSSMDKAELVCRQIKDMGRQSWVVTADLSKPEEAQALGDRVENVDILVSNASIQYKKPWMDISVQDYVEQMNCNFYASLALIQRLTPYMQAQHWGRIVTIGSVQEKKPHHEMLVYSASKCAQTGLVLSLATQLAQDGITVNSVAPGVIATDRNLGALKDKEYAAFVASTIPAGFYGKKEDLSGIVLTLCSEYGRYITGQSIFVDGGKSL